MKSQLVSFALACALSITLTACGGDSTGGSEGAKAEPTKAQMIKDLHAMAKAANANDADSIMKMIRLPESEKENKAKISANVIKSIVRELTDDGIKKLEAKATFGALTELFPERGARWATRADADPAKSFALKLDGAEVAALWNGTDFEYLRVDDVAKLK